MKRAVSTITLVLLLCAFLAGCSGSPAATAPATTAPATTAAATERAPLPDGPIAAYAPLYDPVTEQYEIPEFPDVTFQRKGGILYANDEKTVGYSCLRDPILTDVNGDGIPELCLTLNVGSGITDDRVLIMDFTTREILFELSDRLQHDYFAFIQDEKLRVEEHPASFSFTPFPGSESATRVGTVVVRDGRIAVDWDIASDLSAGAQ